jgi:hypothetical protein
MRLKAAMRAEIQPQRVPPKESQKDSMNQTRISRRGSDLGGDCRESRNDKITSNCAVYTELPFQFVYLRTLLEISSVVMDALFMGGTVSLGYLVTDMQDLMEYTERALRH